MSAMQACLRARRAWEAAGRPGPDPQLPLFEAYPYEPTEVVRVERRTRRRRRRR